MDTRTRTAPAVEIFGLTRHFGTGDRLVRAVNGIDITIDRGEVVALLGPNGAGKTTALDLLLGLSEPSDGRVSVLGRTPRQAVAAGHISAVLQTGGLLSDITVAQTVAVIAGFHRASTRVAEIMDRTGLTPISRRRVGKCSGGEQQRIKFALALLPDPDVLILDEPTAGMDVVARRHFWEVMQQEAREGRTILFATHYLEEAEQFAQRTIVMNHGRVVADGSTAQLRATLGGRTVTALMPEAVAQKLLEETRRDPTCDIAYADGRITARATSSDALAARLLELGAHDLEITAPTLETAFTKLTEG